MIFTLGPLRKQLFGLALKEVGFDARGFKKGDITQKRLELVGKTVVNGYNVAIENGVSDDLRVITQSINKELQGFFHEGVGMGLYVRDTFSLYDRDRFFRFINDEAPNHEYMSYIGAGLASGVFNLPINNFLKRACPITGCLIVDGIGFYYAYFKTKKTIDGKYVPRKISRDPFFQNRFDAGLGRAVWFIKCGDPQEIAELIASFPEPRRKAIWSGVGLAATYACGVSIEDIDLLRQKSGTDLVSFAIGSVLAAHTRHQAGIPLYNEDVVKIISGVSSHTCHSKALEYLEDLRGKEFVNGKRTFQVWLERVEEWLSASLECGQLEHDDSSVEQGLQNAL